MHLFYSYCCTPAVLEGHGKLRLVLPISLSFFLSYLFFLRSPPRRPKVSFVNLQEYDLTELRAVYAVLPAVFQLDATPGHEHEKKHWREALVKALKDLIERQRLAAESSFAGTMGLLPHEERNGAYCYPTAEEVSFFFVSLFFFFSSSFLHQL